MTARSQYFEELKALAREKRGAYCVKTSACGLREIRRIYALERVKIDSWTLPNKVKAVYMCDDGISSVAIQSSLPKEPKLFALIHELKHHFCDQSALKSGEIRCGDYNANELIEVGAEVFAAEFLYPENEFENDAIAFCASNWTAEHIVRFKRDCVVAVSYTFIRKRLERCGLIAPNDFADTRFKKLEDQIFGVPFYKQDWFKKRRAKA